MPRRRACGTTPIPPTRSSPTPSSSISARVEPSLAGPRRPQDRVALGQVAAAFDTELPRLAGVDKPRKTKVEGANYELGDGDVVIAAITSCTNTSNPSVMLAAGLLAKKANERGLKVKPWVKTSLAPGSQVVSDYYAASGLQDDLDKLGFNLVGYGCTTCIGNSGPLPEPIAEAIDEGDLAVAAVLSGNRNFEGRIHAQVRANYLASPPLVVAYALAGSVRHNLATEPLGEGSDDKPVYLKDIWPSNREVADTVAHAVSREAFARRYGNVFEGPPEWRAITGGRAASPTISRTPRPISRCAPYFENMPKEPPPVKDVTGARELAIFGDSITTDHISPAGSIKTDGPAGEYLISFQVRPSEFNTYGARRGNHNVMVRGTFANIRIRNEMVPGVEGGMTKLMPDGTVMAIYDAAMEYKKRGVPLVIFGGKEYGTGSSRDWAAKGTLLLGRQGGDRRELRAHPPLEPRRHGRPAAAVPRRRQPPDPEADRRRGARHHRRRSRPQTAHDADPAHPRRGRRGARGAGRLPHRHARRGRILPPRRHPAIRAARPVEGGVAKADCPSPCPSPRGRGEGTRGEAGAFLPLPACGERAGVRGPLARQRVRQDAGDDQRPADRARRGDRARRATTRRSRRRSATPYWR